MEKSCTAGIDRETSRRNANAHLSTGIQMSTDRLRKQSRLSADHAVSRLRNRRLPANLAKHRPRLHPGPSSCKRCSVYRNEVGKRRACRRKTLQATRKAAKILVTVEKRLHIHRSKCAKTAFLQTRPFLSNIAPASIQGFSSVFNVA